MAKSLFWLSDEAWEALGPHLPRGRPGKPRVDDRTVISGILHVLKTGCRWRDVAPAYGPPTTIYNRYNRWSQRRVWQRIFEITEPLSAATRSLGTIPGWREARSALALSLACGPA